MVGIIERDIELFRAIGDEAEDGDSGEFEGIESLIEGSGLDLGETDDHENAIGFGSEEFGIRETEEGRSVKDDEVKEGRDLAHEGLHFLGRDEFGRIRRNGTGGENEKIGFSGRGLNGELKIKIERNDGAKAIKVRQVEAGM